MAKPLNGIGRRNAIMNFIVFLVIATSIDLISIFLLLSAAIQASNSLIRKKLIAKMSRGQIV